MIEPVSVELVNGKTVQLMLTFDVRRRIRKRTGVDFLSQDALKKIDEDHVPGMLLDALVVWDPDSELWIHDGRFDKLSSDQLHSLFDPNCILALLEAVKRTNRLQHLAESLGLVPTAESPEAKATTPAATQMTSGTESGVVPDQPGSLSESSGTLT